MENWRRRTGDNNRGYDESRRRSMTKKPPRAANWQPTVPYWEKKFCKAVSGLDWDTILDKKRFAHLYDNVVKWNDSAGEEAFHNAKKRFFAQMRGWPCEISLPSPDLYIDKVDWDAQVDLQLLLELEHESLVPNKAEVHDEPVIDFGDTLISNLGLSPAGWGDEGLSPAAGWGDEGLSPAAGWGDENKIFRKATNSSWNNYDNSWKQNQCQIEAVENANPLDKGCEVLVDTGWDDSWLEMEAAENNGVSQPWQVDNGGPYETSYGSSRLMNSNNYNQGRYKWRSNGKREMMV